jgi:hypothetical protein
LDRVPNRKRVGDDTRRHERDTALKEAVHMILLEWLAILVITALLITVLTKRSWPLWTIGVVILVGVSLAFVLPTVTGAVTTSF